ATDYYQTATNIYWAISALLSPVNTAMRYLTSQAGVSRPWAMLQQNLVLWFYTAFLQRLGTYLVDLNSGRLRVGADRSRQLLKELDLKTVPVVDEDRSNALGAIDTNAGLAGAPGKVAEPSAVTIGLFGQVKAGKSSLVNALLGEQRARTHVLPETRDV